MHTSTFRFGELFSGPGGLGLGASRASDAGLGASIAHAWATDYDEDTCHTYAQNVLAAGHQPVRRGQPHPSDAAGVYFADIHELNTDLLPPIDALAFGSPCFAAGTPILTRRGSLPIEEVIIGDEVWTHRNRWRRVTHTMNRVAETVRFGAITGTPDHPFWSAEQKTRYPVAYKNGPQRAVHTLENFGWTDMGATKGNFLATPSQVEGPPLDFPCDPWIAGRYVADGWTDKRGRICFAVGAGKEEEFEARLIQEGYQGWQAHPSGPHCVRYTVPDADLAEWLKSRFGKYAPHKTLPVELLSSSKAIRSALLDGYLSGDGYKHRQGKGSRFVTVSEQLASQMRLLCTSLGYSTWVYKVHPPAQVEIEGRIVNQRNRYEVGLSPSARYTFQQDGFMWSKQRKDPIPSGRQRVYDITVDEDHSFTAWGYAVHNCNDFSLVGEKLALNGAYGPLYSYGVTVLTSHQPQWFLFENVGGIRGENFEHICREFEAAGYRLYPHYYDFSDYGVPQRRKRVVVIGIRDDLDVEYRVPAQFAADVSAATALSGIPADAANHQQARTNALTVERLRHIKPGQNAWTAELPYHLRINTKTTISSMYRRLLPDAPSYTVTGAGGGGYHIYHHEEPRPLTNRERARLQSFDDDFIFVGGRESVRKQIGMAVPPAAAQVIFEAVLKSFAGIDYDWVESNMARSRPGIPDRSALAA